MQFYQAASAHTQLMKAYCYFNQLYYLLSCVICEMMLVWLQEANFSNNIRKRKYPTME